MNTEHETVGDVPPDFGDYVLIEQKRYGVPNEMYVHKVVGRLRSNTWVDVPVQTPATATMHDTIEDVVACICCGVDETQVRRYRLSDVKLQRANARESAAQVGAPEGWSIRADGDEIRITAPNGVPGGITLTPKALEETEWDDLPAHLLYALGTALLSVAPAPAAEPDPKPAPEDDARARETSVSRWEEAANNYARGFAAGVASSRPSPEPRAAAAFRSLEALGYTYHGGTMWKPPIGKPPAYVTEPAASLSLLGTFPANPRDVQERQIDTGTPQPAPSDEDLRVQLADIQRKLEARGIVSVRPHIERGASLSKALRDTVEFLTAYLDGRHEPAAPIGDSNRVPAPSDAPASPQAAQGDTVTIDAHWLQNIASAAALLEQSASIMDKREGAALRKLLHSASSHHRWSFGGSAQGDVEALLDSVENIQAFARAYKAEVPNAELTVHGIAYGLGAVARRLASAQPATAKPAGDADLSELDRAIETLRRDDEHGLYDGLCDLRKRLTGGSHD